MLFSATTSPVTSSFEIGFPFLTVLSFNFYKLELRKLHWRDYIVSDNPVAAALLSKMGFKPEEKVRVKLEFMRMLTRTEEEQLYRELDRIDSKEADAIMQITTSWYEKGRLEGKAEKAQELLDEDK